MYSQSITRTHRTAFVLLIDTSGSMAEDILFRGLPVSKAEAVATITNELIFELIERARRSDGVRNYYDIAILGYGGENQVRSLLGHDEPRFVAIDELAARTVEKRISTLELRLPNGSIALRDIQQPQWIKPQAMGETPMLDALRMARDLMSTWINDPANADSFPPMIFHITDGVATDAVAEDLLDVAAQIRSLRTTDGEVLLLNMHVSNQHDHGMIFPTPEEGATLRGEAALLYALSSSMPAGFRPIIESHKTGERATTYRGMGFNASMAELITMLDIGSISVKTE